MGCEIFTQTSPSFWVKVHALLGVDRGGSIIVHKGGDCRCEVSLQSYSPSTVGRGLRNAHFCGFWGDFSVGVEICKLLGVHY